jgi:hypothetical protein
MEAITREEMIFTLRHCYGWSSIDLYKMSLAELTEVYTRRTSPR